MKSSGHLMLRSLRAHHWCQLQKTAGVHTSVTCLAKERTLPIGTNAERRSEVYQENFENMSRVVDDLKCKIYTADDLFV